MKTSFYYSGLIAALLYCVDASSSFANLEILESPPKQLVLPISNDTVPYTYKLQNLGTVPIVITNVMSADDRCKVNFPTKPILPNKKFSISVSCSQMSPGFHSRTLNVIYHSGQTVLTKSLVFSYTLIEIDTQNNENIFKNASPNPDWLVRFRNTPVTGQQFPITEETPDFFREHSIIELLLEADYTRLSNPNTRVPVESPGILKTVTGERVHVSLETRGMTRLEQCRQMPPVKVRFLSDKSKTIFKGVGKTLKLVTPCYGVGFKDEKTLTWSEYDEWLNREYWIYRFLQEAGLPALKVRKVILRIAIGKKSVVLVPAFFIQDREDFAADYANLFDANPGKLEMLSLLAGASFDHFGGYNRTNGRTTSIRNTPIDLTTVYDFDRSFIVNPFFKSHIDLKIPTTRKANPNGTFFFDAWERSLNRLQNEDMQYKENLDRQINKIIALIRRSDLSIADQLSFVSYYEFLQQSIYQEPNR